MAKKISIVLVVLGITLIGVSSFFMLNNKDVNKGDDKPSDTSDIVTIGNYTVELVNKDFTMRLEPYDNNSILNIYISGQKKYNALNIDTVLYDESGEEIARNGQWAGMVNLGDEIISNVNVDLDRVKSIKVEVKTTDANESFVSLDKTKINFETSQNNDIYTVKAINVSGVSLKYLYAYVVFYDNNKAVATKYFTIDDTTKEELTYDIDISNVNKFNSSKVIINAVE